MQYRPLGSTGISPSILGFGAMRLPVVDGDNARIDEPAATALVREAIDSGVTYVDAAYPYHGPGWPQAGMCEPFLGRALQDGYRDRVTLATKLTPETVESPQDLEQMLDSQLTRLQTDRIDCYLVHSLTRSAWEKMLSLGVLDVLDRAKADGRIRFAGFSFHDSVDVFKEIVDSYAWDFCQIQLNYMDTEFQAGLEGLRYASDKGLGVIVMEPLKGGRLARKAPEDVERAWADSGVVRSPAEWALRWVWAQPGVSLLLSGMTTAEQLRENISIASADDVGVFSPEEYAAVERVKETFASRTVADCTGCRYCMPCPFGLDIPTYLKMLNNASIYNDRDNVKSFYDEHPHERASECTRCGTCEPRCPQHLPIPDLMEKVVDTFER